MSHVEFADHLISLIKKDGIEPLPGDPMYNKYRRLVGLARGKKSSISDAALIKLAKLAGLPIEISVSVTIKK